MPMTIFDLVKSQELTSYWETLTQDRAPYFGETLFPSQQKLGLSLDWLKGANGLPVVLKPSAFDSKAIPRARLGFEKLTAQMPFFKESSYVDEELRQYAVTRSFTRRDEMSMQKKRHSGYNRLKGLH